MRLLSLTIILLRLIFASVAVAQQPTDDNYAFDALREKIVSFVASGWSSYSICEYVDLSNKPSYVDKLILEGEMPASDDAVIARYFVAQRQGESTGVDFSLYRIQFASSEAAMRALNSIRTGKIGSVEDGKVLTKYAAQLDGNNIYIICTQSFLDAEVRSVLESFARGEIKVR